MSLSTSYLGLKLKNPLIASASPLTAELGNIRALEDNGAAAVVMPSIFEEQIEAEAEQLERLQAMGAESTAEAMSYFPAAADYRTGARQTLETIRRAREAVDIPIIASLNGISDSGWTGYATELEQAGASAIELNIFFIPSDLGLSSTDVEWRYREVLQAVKGVVNIPVSVKLSPYFSAPGAVIQDLAANGADGFVLFNRFYQPDIDLGSMSLLRDLALSTPAEIRLPLLWIGILAGHIDASLAATTGVQTSDEVVKYLLAGADAVMTTSSLLRHGVGHMRTLLDGLTEWLDVRSATVAGIKGSMSHRRLKDPASYERANYIRILQGWQAPHR